MNGKKARVPSQIWGQQGKEGPPGPSIFHFKSKAHAQVLPKNPLGTRRPLRSGPGLAPGASQRAIFMKMILFVFCKNSWFLKCLGTVARKGCDFGNSGCRRERNKFIFSQKWFLESLFGVFPPRSALPPTVLTALGKSFWPQRCWLSSPFSIFQVNHAAIFTEGTQPNLGTRRKRGPSGALLFLL